MIEAELIEAVVQVGAAETRYLRCGRGARTVVALAPDPAERLRLMARFAAEHRVIAPSSDACSALRGGDPATLQEWLRGLLDGLGLERPIVALAPALAALAPRLLAECGDAADVVVTGPHGS